MGEFPTHSGAWIAGLSHLGHPTITGRTPLLRRAIPGTDRQDALLSWPYLLVDPTDLVDDLAADQSGLVSAVGTVMVPGRLPSGTAFSPRTPHYVYDPERGDLAYSSRTRAHISRGRRIHGEVVWHANVSGAQVHAIYRDVVRRYGLAKGFFDFRLQHFEYFSSQPDAQVACVVAAEAVAAAACLIRHGNEIHVVHFLVSDAGLRTDAGPLLASALVARAAREGSRLHFAGVPSQGRPGLASFKERFTNCRRPVWLARVILDVNAYNDLASTSSSTYFPAYRAR